MSTMFTPPSPSASSTGPSFSLDVSQTARVPFARIVMVELRKMVDTRAGRWLVGVTLGLILLSMVIALPVAALNDLTLSLKAWLQILTIPMSLLLPAIAIMSVTQEWGQRTALVTFALEPNRLRVVLAKFVCVMVMAVTTIVFAAVLAVIGNLLFQLVSGQDAGWSIPFSLLAWSVALQLAYFIMAFGFGLLFLSTPIAIVVYYVVSLLLPVMVYGPLMALVSWGPDVVPWIDLGVATAPYTTPEMDKPDLAPLQVLFTTLLWVALPNVLGFMRVRKVELK